MSKIEAGMMTVTSDMISVEELCTASLLFIKEQACRKQLRLVLTTQTAPTFILTDPLRLKQILINLLSNAVKFTPEGGEVELQVEGCSQGERIDFTVRDTGIGISVEDQARLFQPFVQVDNSLTRQYEGTGLGLALISRLTALLDGEVTLESEPEKGSRFTISLPGVTVNDRETDGNCRSRETLRAA